VRDVCPVLLYGRPDRRLVRPEESHVLPGLDAEAAGTVARLILGDRDQEPARPVDKALTTDRPAPSRREEVKREAPGQRGVRAGGFEPPRVAPPGPKLRTRCASWCAPGLRKAGELGGCRIVVPSWTRSSRGVAARPVSNLVSIGGSGSAWSRTPPALRSSATRDRSAGRARQGRCSLCGSPTVGARGLGRPGSCRGPRFSDQPGIPTRRATKWRMRTGGSAWPANRCPTQRALVLLERYQRRVGPLLLRRLGSSILSSSLLWKLVGPFSSGRYDRDTFQKFTSDGVSLVRPTMGCSGAQRTVPFGSTLVLKLTIVWLSCSRFHTRYSLPPGPKARAGP
jgi:hypothetical protein